MRKLFTLALVLLLMGCSGNKENKQLNYMVRDHVVGEKKILRQRPQKEPDWISSTYRAAKSFPEYELFVGISPFATNEKEAVKMAEENAINQLAVYLGVSIESEIKNSKFLNKSMGEEELKIIVEEKSRQAANNFAKGIKILETYTEWGERYSENQIWENYVQCYVLYGLEKTEYLKSQEEILKNLDF